MSMHAAPWMLIVLCRVVDSVFRELEGGSKTASSGETGSKRLVKVATMLELHHQPCGHNVLRCSLPRAVPPEVLSK